jgi:hypothetical protein
MRSIYPVPQIRSVERLMSSDEARGSDNKLMRLMGARGGSRRFVVPDCNI